jgi:hypothetical protein
LQVLRGKESIGIMKLDNGLDGKNTNHVRELEEELQQIQMNISIGNVCNVTIKGIEDYLRQ